MSLKVGFVLFYVSFISIFIFFTGEIGVTILSIDRSNLVSISDGFNAAYDPISFFFQLLTNTILFFVQTFFIFALVTITDPTFLILNIFLIVPLTIAFAYLALEFIRGIG